MEGIEGYQRDQYGRKFRREYKAALKKAGREVGKKAKNERIEGLKAANRARQSKIKSNSKRSGRRKDLTKGSGGISRIRRKAIKYVVGRDGTLVLLDLAPFAQLQETGGTIRPTSGSQLFISDKRRRPRPGDNVFVTEEGVVLAKKPYRKRDRRKLKDGTVQFGPKKRQPKPRYVGKFVDSVKYPQLPRNARLRVIAAKYYGEYAAAVEKNLAEGYR